MFSKPIIQLKDIVKDYQIGDEFYRALKGISLEINQGEFAAIMGPSGSGKSTLMHIMGALDTPTSGEYLFDGKNISSYSEDQLAEIRNKEVGFVFQTFNLLPRTTVFKNVERPMLYANIGAKDRFNRTVDALKKVNLLEKKDNLSNQISGGQIQRVAIARALVMQPRIILADEPTGNLDSLTAKEIMKFLKELNDQGNTIVLITHEADIAAWAKRIINLKDGLIVPDGKN